jgi:hypothetical protein
VTQASKLLVVLEGKLLLRDHPLMSRKGARNWPVWTWTLGQRNKYPKRGGRDSESAAAIQSHACGSLLPAYFLSRSRISRLPAIRRPRFLQAHNRRSSVLPQSSHCRDWQLRSLLYVVEEPHRIASCADINFPRSSCRSAESSS